MQNVFNNLDSLSDACRYFKFPVNTNGINKVKSIITEHNVDITHFTRKKNKRIYERTIKICPVCNKEFETILNHSHEKTTCSHSCSNTFFRTGTNNPNWREDSYRSTCFKSHKKECVICGENKIVAVHHYDENRKNNSIENLIPLCPTHHQYVHSRYKEEVMDKINKYRNQFITNK